MVYEVHQPSTQLSSDTLLIHRVWSEAGSATPICMTCDLPSFNQVASEVITTSPSIVSETLSTHKARVETSGVTHIPHDLSSNQQELSEGMPTITISSTPSQPETTSHTLQSIYDMMTAMPIKFDDKLRDV